MVHQTWLRRIRVGDPTELLLVGHSFRPHDNFLVHVRTLTCVARALVVNTPSFGVLESLSRYPPKGRKRMHGSPVLSSSVSTRCPLAGQYPTRRILTDWVF